MVVVEKRNYFKEIYYNNYKNNLFFQWSDTEFRKNFVLIIIIIIIRTISFSNGLIPNSEEFEAACIGQNS